MDGVGEASVSEVALDKLGLSIVGVGNIGGRRINDDYAAYLGLVLQKRPGGNTDLKGAVNLSHTLWTGFSHFANSNVPQTRGQENSAYYWANGGPISVLI